jgi:hypothetical protein
MPNITFTYAATSHLIFHLKVFDRKLLYTVGVT